MSAVSCTYFILGEECLGQLLNKHEVVDGARKLVAYNTALAYPVGIVFAAALLFISALREILGLGTLFGSPVIGGALFPMAQLPSGGFMVTALVMCVWRAAAAGVKKQMSLEVEPL